nr:hypothetical protein [Paenibacillus xylanexedens]
MRVAELIEELANWPGDADVILADCEDDWSTGLVTVSYSAKNSQVFIEAK